MINNDKEYLWECDNPQCNCRLKDEESVKMHERALNHTMTKCRVLK